MFQVDEAAYCSACGEALVRESGFPLGTALIATAYLALVATLTATRQLRPALLGAAALLAIALARIFAVNRKLRRPVVIKTSAGKENVLVVEAKADANVDASAPADANAKGDGNANADANADANTDANANADADANTDANADGDADADANADANANPS